MSLAFLYLDKSQQVAPLLVYDRPDSHALGAVLLWELQKNCGAGAPRDEQRYPVPGSIIFDAPPVPRILLLNRLPQLQFGESLV